MKAELELVSHVETSWRDWTFRDLLDALRKRTEINSVPKLKRSKDNFCRSQSAGGHML